MVTVCSYDENGLFKIQNSFSLTIISHFSKSLRAAITQALSFSSFSERSIICLKSSSMTNASLLENHSYSFSETSKTVIFIVFWK